MELFQVIPFSTFQLQTCDQGKPVIIYVFQDFQKLYLRAFFLLQKCR